MLAPSIGVQAGVEGNVRAIVAGDDGVGGFGEKLRLGARIARLLEAVRIVRIMDIG
jgi:hypothetical protein